MAKNKKLSKEEFDKLKSLSERYQTLLYEIGSLDVKKASLLNTFPAVSGELSGFQMEIREKYGEGKVNPTNGEIENAN